MKKPNLAPTFHAIAGSNAWIESKGWYWNSLIRSHSQRTSEFFSGFCIPFPCVRKKGKEFKKNYCFTYVTNSFKEHGFYFYQSVFGLICWKIFPWHEIKTIDRQNWQIKVFVKVKVYLYLIEYLNYISLKCIGF